VHDYIGFAFLSGVVVGVVVVVGGFDDNACYCYMYTAAFSLSLYLSLSARPPFGTPAPTQSSLFYVLIVFYLSKNYVKLIH